MKYIIDTCVFIWTIQEPNRLSSKSREIIEDKNNQLIVSMASIWEIAIKVSIGKLKLLRGFESFVSYERLLHDISLLSPTMHDSIIISKLPFIHKDPFDRLIISQAISNNLAIITSDGKMPQYDVQIIW